MKKNSESLHDVWIQSEEKKLQIDGIPEGERSRKPIKEIIAENLRTGEFPKSEKNLEIHWSNSGSSSRHAIIKL